MKLKEIVERIKLRKVLLKVDGEVLNDYCTKVKGNLHTPKLQARKKLTRNVLYAKRTGTWLELDGGHQVYFFGNLSITVKGNRVVMISNKKGKSRGFVRDKELCKDLNQQLLIKE